MGAVLSLLHTKMESSTTSSHNLQDQVDLDVEYETLSIQQLCNESEGLSEAKFP